MSLYFDFLKNDEVRKRDIKKERIVIVKISICKKINHIKNDIRSDGVTHSKRASG